jgi:Ca-activated chloride channel family protein
VRDLRKQGYRLSVLGIGTEQGGAMYQEGVAEFVFFNAAPLQALARAGGGAYSLITPDDQDLSHLLPDIELTGAFDKVESSGIERWIERAVWLLPLILLLAASAFRRGWLMGFAVLLIIPPPAHAFGWQDLWQRSDQQAQKQLQQGDPQTAAEQFRSPDWRGMALYEIGDYSAAAQAFAKSDNVYNQGNALAQAGELQQAIAAYQEVLQQNPGHKDARANLDLLEALLKQQPPQDDDSSPSEEGDESSSSEDKSDEMSDNPEDSAQQDEAESSDENLDQQQTEPSPADQDEGDEQPDALEADRADDNHDLPSEEDIALEQWLRQIPEDPSGLLRRKFMLEHLQRKESR